VAVFGGGVQYALSDLAWRIPTERIKIVLVVAMLNEFVGNTQMDE
jgi:hypothetical protein